MEQVVWCDKMKKLEEIIGYKFKKPRLLKQAMTHGSHSSRFNENYERLEFLGDRVLGVVVAKILYDTFPEDKEGDLSQRFVGLVCKETVAEVALKLELDKFAVIANEEIRHNDGLLCDLCEAVIGAIFVDGGVDDAFSFVSKNWLELVKKNKQPPKDAKTSLQEVAHVKGYGVPKYEILKREGSEHEPTFHIAVSFEKVKPIVGVGKSKKIAEQDAAKKMLEIIGNDNGKRCSN